MAFVHSHYTGIEDPRISPMHYVSRKPLQRSAANQSFACDFRRGIKNMRSAQHRFVLPYVKGKLCSNFSLGRSVYTSHGRTYLHQYDPSEDGGHRLAWELCEVWVHRRILLPGDEPIRHRCRTPTMNRRSSPHCGLLLRSPHSPLGAARPTPNGDLLIRTADDQQTDALRRLDVFLGTPAAASNDDRRNTV